jgi:uracil phosphoribosyltransferase
MEGNPRVKDIFVINHPVLQHKLTLLRDKNTSCKQFRELVVEAAELLTYEATRDLALVEQAIETPVAPMTGQVLAGKKLCAVAVLRAGLGMTDGVLNLLPAAKIAHIGLYRDEQTFQPVQYYVNMPSDLAERDVLVLDPMLATGGSASASLKLIKEQGAKRLKFVCLLAAPEGISQLRADHPDVPIYTAAIDERLTEAKFITPGLGDAGDRLFGTK